MAAVEQPVREWVGRRLFPLFFGTELDQEYRLCLRLGQPLETPQGAEGPTGGHVHPALLQEQFCRYESFKLFQAFLASRPGGACLPRVPCPRTSLPTISAPSHASRRNSTSAHAKS